MPTDIVRPFDSKRHASASMTGKGAANQRTDRAALGDAAAVAPGTWRESVRAAQSVITVSQPVLPSGLEIWPSQGLARYGWAQDTIQAGLRNALR